MPKYFLYSIVVVAVTIFLSCDKSSDDVCHGCGIDTSVKEYQFNVSGRIFEDCSGIPASNRMLQFDIFYKEDSLSLTAQTNEMGAFSFNYTKMLPGDYAMSASRESYCLLKVKEDSVTFFLNGLEDHKGLNLNVDDSLDVSFYLNVFHDLFIAGDTISLRFEPPVMAGHYYPCIIGGPIQDKTLIYTIKDKWRFVILDDYDQPVFKFYANVDRRPGYPSLYSYSITQPKVPCIMSPQEIRYYVN